MSVRPANTQISLGFHPVWSESLLCSQWVTKYQKVLHVDRGDSNQTELMPRLIWVFSWNTATLTVFSSPSSIKDWEIRPREYYLYVPYRLLSKEIPWVKINKFFERKIFNISLPIRCNICFGCSKEPSHWDGSFEYPQHMFWLRNKKIIFWVRTLTKSLDTMSVLCLNLSKYSWIS